MSNDPLVALFSWSTRPLPKGWVEVTFVAPCDEPVPEVTYTGHDAVSRIYRQALFSAAGMLGTRAAEDAAMKRIDAMPTFYPPEGLTVVQSNPTHDTLQMVVTLPAEPAHLWRTRLAGQATGKDAALRQVLFLDTFVRRSDAWALQAPPSSSEA